MLGVTAASSGLVSVLANVGNPIRTAGRRARRYCCGCCCNGRGLAALHYANGCVILWAGETWKAFVTIATHHPTRLTQFAAVSLCVASANRSITTALLIGGAFIASVYTQYTARRCRCCVC